MAATLMNRAGRPSTAGSIDDDLVAVWRELAREAPLVRALMSNLVVFCRAAAGDQVDLASPPKGIPIDEVARNHPARIILLYHDSNAAAEDAAAEPTLAAHVGVLTFGPADARYGVEQIVIRTACSEAALPSLVRRLMLGDVPTSVWWTEDLSGIHPVVPLVGMGRQLVYDSRRWSNVSNAVMALAPLLTKPFGLDLADVNWRRLLPVRRAFVHAIGSSNNAKRQQLGAVQIHYRPGEAALAWLLGGWLQYLSGLADVWGPPSGGPIRPEPDPTLITVGEDSDLDGEVLTASFNDGLHMRLSSHRVSVDDPLGPAPFSLAVPSETEAEAIAAELCVLTHDAALHGALAALVARFGGA